MAAQIRDCNHNSDGPIYTCLNENWVLKSIYFPVWMDAKQQMVLIEKNHWNISGESTSCSKCGSLLFYVTLKA